MLAAGNIKQNELKKHLDTGHAEFVGKMSEFFRRKLNEFNKEKQIFSKKKKDNRCLKTRIAFVIAKCKELDRLEKV
jgi:hypothetical protein